MSKPWNLTPTEWSNVLQTTSGVEKTAQEIKEGKILPWVQALLPLTSKFESVLDLGSGAGQHSAFLALNGRKTTLIDWSKKNVDFSVNLFKCLGIEGEFYQADIRQKLPFADNCFDTVFSCGVFEYFTDAEIVAILNEAFRVARKRVIIIVPNAVSIFYRLGMKYLRLRNKWVWGGERPFLTLKPYIKSLGNYQVHEVTIGAKHSLNFLTMPFGKIFKKFILTCFRLKDHPQPALLRQGYVLMTIAEKEQG